MTESPAILARPVWESVEGDINCPLCDYNLRGLPEPRCPECGYRFHWPDLLDPTRRKHPFVFEHHPNRNVWSFAKTLWAGTRPARFWRSLHPAQPASLRRLIQYVVIVATFVVSASLPGIVGGAVAMAAGNRGFRTRIQQRVARDPTYALQLNIAPFSSVKEWMDHVAPPVLSVAFVRDLVQTVRRTNRIVILCAVYVTWPALTLAALLIFRWSMRRARVRTIHVFRCIAYTFDTTVWMVLAFLVAGSAMAAYTMSPSIADSLFALLLLFVGVSLAMMTYRLSVAYRVYLQFDRPFATAVASQAIVVLTAMNLILYVTFGR